MPKLKCSAMKCIYNCENLCTKSVIHINDDIDAKRCLAFKCKKYDYEHNFNTEFANFDGLNQFISIECEAKKCDYNCNGMCASENVKIVGCNSTCANQTKCQTFSE